MAVSRAWRDTAKANYMLRIIDVPASADALLHAAARAQSGDTLRLVAGTHQLSSELTVDRPLRILSHGEADRVLARAHPEEGASSSSWRQVANDDVVLVATLHILLRTRCSALVSGLTLCRMGEAPVGYPNAVVYAETGTLRLVRCRITRGGAPLLAASSRLRRAH